MASKAKPDSVQEKLDVDTRFLLANERTLLAWIRTSLAVIAGGLLLTQLDTSTAQAGFGIIAILFGAVMAMNGYARFLQADRAIRSGELPAAGNGLALHVIAVVFFALAIAVVEITRL